MIPPLSRRLPGGAPLNIGGGDTKPGLRLPIQNLGQDNIPALERIITLRLQRPMIHGGVNPSLPIGLVLSLRPNTPHRLNLNATGLGCIQNPRLRPKPVRTNLTSGCQQMRMPVPIIPLTMRCMNRNINSNPVPRHQLPPKPLGKRNTLLRGQLGRKRQTPLTGDDRVLPPFRE